VITATLTPDSPRRKTWLAAFGSDRVPITSTDPTRDGRFYIDVSSLSVAAKKQLFRYCAAQWLMPVDEAAQRVKRESLPVKPGDDLVIDGGNGELFL
jgi:hypothetical protein